MSRLEAWIDEDDMERQDVASMVRDRWNDIAIYRMTDLSDDDGFRAQVPARDHRLLKVVKGRIDRRNQTFRNSDGEFSKTIDVLFIATLYTKDVKIGDQLKLQNVTYEVKAVNIVGQSFTEAELEVQE